jgi:hypothetical protein
LFRLFSFRENSFPTMHPLLRQPNANDPKTITVTAVYAEMRRRPAMRGQITIRRFKKNGRELT